MKTEKDRQNKMDICREIDRKAYTDAIRQPLQIKVWTHKYIHPNTKKEQAGSMAESYHHGNTETSERESKLRPRKE